MSESNNPQRNDTIRYDTMRRYLVMFGLATSNKRPLHLFLSRSFFFFPCDTLQVFRSGTLRAGTEKDMACKCKANANANQNNTDTLHSSCTRANKITIYVDHARTNVKLANVSIWTWKTTLHTYTVSSTKTTASG